jgi:membrane fusion protein (multidrug efflux system)
MMRNNIIYILIVCSGFAACGSPAANTTAGNAAAASEKGKDTVPAFLLAQKKIKKKVELPAELLPYEQAELSAKVQGYIREMKVDIGDHVRKGQTLAVVEAPEVNTKYAEFQASLLSANAKYAASADEYRRLLNASRANTAGIVAPVDLERSRQQMLADSASLKAAEKLAQSYKEVSNYLFLQAPFEGVVTARKADPGDLVGTNNMIVSVQDNRILRLRVAVPEAFISSNAAADTIRFKSDAYPERVFMARLTRKTETIDPVTRTELWEYDYNNRNRELKAGAFAYVQLNIERPFPSFVVPFSAIATTQEKKFVIRSRAGKAEWVDVRSGITMDDGQEIFGDLSPGDTLVLRASDERKPGSTAYWKVNKPAN